MLLYYHVTYLILPRKQIGFQKKRKNSTTILYTVVSPQISELLTFKKPSSNTPIMIMTYIFHIKEKT